MIEAPVSALEFAAPAVPATCNAANALNYSALGSIRHARTCPGSPPVAIGPEGDINESFWAIA
jgi:hypothetical protein